MMMHDDDEDDHDDHDDHDLFLQKPGSIETNPALVVEVPNVEHISI